MKQSEPCMIERIFFAIFILVCLTFLAITGCGDNPTEIQTNTRVYAGTFEIQATPMRDYGVMIPELLEDPPTVTVEITVTAIDVYGNQVWVDAGLFAMSLLYGLQYKGLGACILHWSVEKKRDIQLRDLTGIKPEQTIICLIAIGQLHDTFKVPNSQRRDLSEILIEIK